MILKNFQVPLWVGLIFLIPLFFLSSCYYDNEDKLYAEYYANKNCDTVNITFAGSIQPILDAGAPPPDVMLGGTALVIMRICGSKTFC
ncbi:MAG: hypothetical protein IPP77_04900 [Bacteroidetes bacterium]|nr:hypothetical protein [Bacteroidota bacterium]